MECQFDGLNWLISDHPIATDRIRIYYNTRTWSTKRKRQKQKDKSKVKLRNFYWQRDADLSNEVWSGTSRVLGPMEKVKKREESRKEDGIIEIEWVAPVKSSQYHELYRNGTCTKQSRGSSFIDSTKLNPKRWSLFITEIRLDLQAFNFQKHLITQDGTKSSDSFGSYRSN